MLARAIQSTIGHLYPPDLAQYGRAIVFDPQDLKTLFQDSAGTTPVTGVEQPVGLMLDKGQGLELGPDLISPIDFTDGSWTFTGATVTFNNANTYTTPSTCNVYKTLFTVGKFYIITVQATFSSSEFTVYNNTSAFNQICATSSGVSLTLIYAAVGTRINLRATGAGTVVVNNISVREIKGFHATQSTAGSRPTLSARYNMLVGTNTLSTQSVTTLATDYTLSFSGTGTVTLSGTATGAKSAGVNVFTATAGTLTLTVSGTVTNAQLVASNQSSRPYQSVTNSTTYDSDPSKFPWYLRFTDHWMVTPSIDATAHDKVVVACGLRKMSDAARGTVIESSTTIASNNGAFALTAPQAAAASIGMESKGTAITDAIATALSAPITRSVVALASIGADSNVIRVNGAAADTDSGDQGTGNFGNYPIYIGKRAGTSAPFNGFFYGATILFPTALPNDNLIAALERHYAAKSGIKL